MNTLVKETAKKGRRSRFRLLRPRIRISERKALLFTGDLVLLNLSFFLLLYFGLKAFERPAALLTEVGWFAIFSFLWILFALFFDAYDLARSARRLTSAWAVGRAAFFTGSVYYLIPFITPPLPDRRLLIVLLPLLLMGVVIAWRTLYATIFVQPIFRQTALIIGAGWSGRTIARALSGQEDPADSEDLLMNYEFIGYVDDDPAMQGQEVEGVPVIGTRYDLVSLVTERRPDEVILAITHSQKIHDELFRAIITCRELGVPVTTMASLYERLTGRVPVEHAGRDLHVVMPLEQPVGYRMYTSLRRLAEIPVSLLGCLVVAVLYPLVWLINRLTAPGDVFYRQTRVGEGGRLFQVIKFRSMVMDAEQGTGAVWAQQNDDRITPLGRLLRRTRLDELPQFWNVLKGEMHIIGPRPERPEFVQKLAVDIPFYRVRHAVKPGLTGWAQVRYRYGASDEDALKKLQYDLYYIKNQGLYLDMLIALKTVQVMLGMKGR